MSNYPPYLKSWLKAAPALVSLVYMNLVLVQILYGALHGPQDHIPKQQFRSTMFERYLRMRDDKQRVYFERRMNWNPNQVHQIRKFNLLK